MPLEDSDLRRESLVRMAREPTHAGSFAVSEVLLDHNEPSRRGARTTS